MAPKCPVTDILLFYILHDYIVNTDALMCRQDFNEADEGGASFNYLIYCPAVKLPTLESQDTSEGSQHDYWG